MPSSGIFELSGITGGTGAVRSDDVLPLVDVHDATQAAQGSLIKITLAQLYRTETTAVTVSTPLPDIAQTWNNAGVTFTAVKLNVTSTASAAASLLLDLQLATVSQWKVTKGGASTQVGVMTASGVTLSTAVSKIIPGATSISLRNNADGADNLIITDAGAATIRAGLTVTAGGITVSAGALTVSAAGGVSAIMNAGTVLRLDNTLTAADFRAVIEARRGGSTRWFLGTNASDNFVALDSTGALANLTITDAGAGTFRAGVTATQLTLSTAVSKIIPGATSISHRNNADSADNLLITDAGAVTTRSTLTVTAGGLTVSAGTTSILALTVNGDVSYSNQAITRSNGSTGGFVSGAATAIYGPSSGAGGFSRVEVFGFDSGSANAFRDVVVYLNSGAATVVTSTTVVGSPTARTYSVTTSTLKVAMASGTYTVKADGLSA